MQSFLTFMSAHASSLLKSSCRVALFFHVLTSPLLVSSAIFTRMHLFPSSRSLMKILKCCPRNNGELACDGLLVSKAANYPNPAAACLPIPTYCMDHLSRSHHTNLSRGRLWKTTVRALEKSRQTMPAESSTSAKQVTTLSWKVIVCQAQFILGKSMLSFPNCVLHLTWQPPGGFIPQFSQIWSKTDMSRISWILF